MNKDDVSREAMDSLRIELRAMFSYVEECVSYHRYAPLPLHLPKGASA
jgi:hypothetical protein